MSRQLCPSLDDALCVHRRSLHCLGSFIYLWLTIFILSLNWLVLKLQSDKAVIICWYLWLQYCYYYYGSGYQFPPPTRSLSRPQVYLGHRHVTRNGRYNVWMRRSNPLLFLIPSTSAILEYRPVESPVSLSTYALQLLVGLWCHCSILSMSIF